MSCSPYDLRDYLFEELTPGQRGEVRLHLKTCAPCVSELEALSLTHSALLALRDEEIPQRIGFVSDKVFEPSPLRRWFAGFWTSAARIGFVSAAMLSAAILIHDLRPVPNASHVLNSAQSAQTAQLTPAEIDRRIRDAVATQVAAQVQTKVAAAVNQAVAETEIRAQKRTNELLATTEERSQKQLQLIRAEYLQYADIMRNESGLAMVAQNVHGGAQ